ncbi:DUF1330 domain-containing protein [Rhodobacterales bacterium HKCCE3408]|nr:DUF1330 domain-containing protein [Rhodobacterales bacterium HKCCE3408]
MSTSKAYWVANIFPKSTRYQFVEDAAVDVIERLGGRVLAQSSHGPSIRGRFRPRMMIVEFDDTDHAASAFDTPELKSIRTLMSDHSDFDFRILPGIQQDEEPTHYRIHGHDWAVKA